MLFKLRSLQILSIRQIRVQRINEEPKTKSLPITIVSIIVNFEHIWANSVE